jgi:hypothetical protein
MSTAVTEHAASTPRVEDRQAGPRRSRKRLVAGLVAAGLVLVAAIGIVLAAGDVPTSAPADSVVYGGDWKDVVASAPPESLVYGGDWKDVVASAPAGPAGYGGDWKDVVAVGG